MKVGDGGPLPDRRPPWEPWRIALVAVCAVIVVGGLVAGGLSRWQSSSRQAPATPIADAAAVGLPPPETFAEVFAPCAHCHEIGQGAQVMTAPPLTGILGRAAGSYPDYPYSQAMRNSAITWDAAKLASFIADPQAVVPGTRMIFGGLSEQQIGPIVSYIQSVAAKSTPPAAGAAITLPASALDIGGPFTLTDTAGNVVTQNDLLGKPSALFFGYTNCPDVCPTTLTDLTALLKEMGADADKLNVFFITIDPERDTASVLANYLSSFDPRIHGLTGTDAQIATIAKAYHIYYERVPASDGSYSMDHTASVTLMDATGHFVGTMSYEEDDKISLAKLEHLVHGAS